MAEKIIDWTIDQIRTGRYKIDPEATDAQLAQFVADMNATQKTFHLMLAPSRLWGKTREEMVADTAAWAPRYKRRAGVRALKAKYGHEIADKIVAKHSGRHIR